MSFFLHKLILWLRPYLGLFELISIFIMFSVDRLSQLNQMISCLKESELYDDCQKILLVDGTETNIEPDGWEVVTVPREDNVFNWSRMWEEGVRASTHETVLYLDSDRILPKKYLTLVRDNIADDRFLFTGQLFNLLKPVTTEELKTYRDTLTPEKIRNDYDWYKKFLWYDPRFALPCDGPGKGVMSGNTAFTKKTFRRCGGPSEEFCGGGAYADSDLHKKCRQMGCEFVDLGVLELHLFHEKLSDDSTEVLSPRDVEILSLNNYVRYCLKWNLNLDRARYIARWLKLPDDFVKATTRKLRPGEARSREREDG